MSIHEAFNLIENEDYDFDKTIIEAALAKQYAEAIEKMDNYRRKHMPDGSTYHLGYNDSEAISYEFADIVINADGTGMYAFLGDESLENLDAWRAEYFEAPGLYDPKDFAAFVCVDCSTNTSEIQEYYMVHDELWHSVGMEPDGGMLCIGCLEKRLGRQLEAKDFTYAPVNHGAFQRSERMMNRLGYTQVWYSPKHGMLTDLTAAA
jgi:hypothetical protein